MKWVSKSSTSLFSIILFSLVLGFSFLACKRDIGIVPSNPEIPDEVFGSWLMIGTSSYTTTEIDSTSMEPYPVKKTVIDSLIMHVKGPVTKNAAKTDENYMGTIRVYTNEDP